MRTIRTLRLNRERLAALGGGDLADIVGGATLRDHCSPTFATCPTEEPRCQWGITENLKVCQTIFTCL